MVARLFVVGLAAALALAGSASAQCSHDLTFAGGVQYAAAPQFGYAPQYAYASPAVGYAPAMTGDVITTASTGRRGILGRLIGRRSGGAASSVIPASYAAPASFAAMPLPISAPTLAAYPPAPAPGTMVYGSMAAAPALAGTGVLQASGTTLSPESGLLPVAGTAPAPIGIAPQGAYMPAPMPIGPAPIAAGCGGCGGGYAPAVAYAPMGGCGSTCDAGCGPAGGRRGLLGRFRR